MGGSLQPIQIAGLVIGATLFGPGAILAINRGILRTNWIKTIAITLIYLVLTGGIVATALFLSQAGLQAI